MPGAPAYTVLGATGSGTGYADFTAPRATPSGPGLPNSGVYRGTLSCPHHR